MKVPPTPVMQALTAADTARISVYVSVLGYLTV